MAIAATAAIAAIVAIAAIAAMAAVRPAVLENRSGKHYVFLDFYRPERFIEKSETENQQFSAVFTEMCVWATPAQSKSPSQKHRKIENVEIGALARIITRSRKAIIRRKCVWATPAQFKIAESASGPCLRSPK